MGGKNIKKNIIKIKIEQNENYPICLGKNKSKNNQKLIFKRKKINKQQNFMQFKCNTSACYAT